MNNFIKTYLDIIQEAKFKDKKWKFDLIYNNVEIYENFTHLEERLKERYKTEISTWFIWPLIKSNIINYMNDIDAWSSCKEKNNYQKMYTAHLTLSDMWVGFVIQNDLEEKTKRIYFTTFLPNEEVKIHSHVAKFNLPL